MEVTRMLTDKKPMEYFKELVSDAIDTQGVEASQMAEFYLTNLLTDFVQSKSVEDEAFAIRLLKALSAERRVQSTSLKEVGDSSLFLTGFFPESLKKSLVSVNYYTDIGIVSYARLADSLSSFSDDRTFPQLYDELSGHFLEFVDVLHEVSERSRLSSATDILRVYEDWLKTGSKHCAAILRELGINPVDTGSDKVN
jgi:glutaredoxin-related protein